MHKNRPGENAKGSWSLKDMSNTQTRSSKVSKQLERNKGKSK